jgi:hypothetical protein
MHELKNARLLFAIGKANVTITFEKALKRCNEVLQDIMNKPGQPLAD